MSCETNLPNESEVALKITPRPLGDCDPKPKTSPRERHNYKSLHHEEEEEEENIVDIENVTVKFRLKGNQTIAQIYPNCMTLSEVKTDIGRRFEISPELLILKQDQRILSDQCSIRETDNDEYGIHEYNLELKTNANKSKTQDENKEQQPKLDLDVYYNKYHLPDFITVYIPAEDSRNGKPKNIVVEIQNRSIYKPFLCGYLDKNTGIEYLDAFTQTGPFINKCNWREYASRDTQTYELKPKFVDTMHDQMSQCWLDGNNVRYWSEATDYCITPGKYVTHAQQERLINRMAKIRLIQRNFRRLKWMKYMKQCALEYRRQVANRLKEETNFNEIQERRIQREQRAKQFPRTKDDFGLLYGEVDKWKTAEMKRIASMYEGAARIAEINILLDKEITLLSGIDRQRQLVFEAMKDFREEQILKEMGKPIKWVGYKDTIIHLDLLRTQRVRFLTEVHKDLQKSLPKEERLELIAKVKHILVNEKDFPSFGELFDLFDRERNLLVYTKFADVDVLRKRQNMLFVELIKFDREPKPHNTTNRMCIVCKKVKPYTYFAIRTRQNQVDTCKKCFYLKESGSKNLVYAAILRTIQREERKKKCMGSVAFILQVDDVRYIVEQIWHGQSILSKVGNLCELRLPRWNKSEEWAPWNCICLTELAARNHERIEDLEQVYSKKVRLEVKNRHMLARNAFHNLAEVSVEFNETGKWWNVGLNKQRKNVNY